MITLNNIVEILKLHNPVKKSRVYGTNKISHYRLIETLTIELSNFTVITIPKGFEWDLASVPRAIWSICSPDNDAELAYLIHDYLYRTQILPKKEADAEMYIWATVTNGTRSYFSTRNIDNKLRYLAVKWFGKKSYNKTKHAID